MKDIKSPSECQKTIQDFNELFRPLELALLGLGLMLNCNARVVTTFRICLGVTPGSLCFYVVFSCNFYKVSFHPVGCILITSFVISGASCCAGMPCAVQGQRARHRASGTCSAARAGLETAQ